MRLSRSPSVIIAGLLAAGMVLAQGCTTFGLVEQRTRVSLAEADSALESVYDYFDPQLQPYLRSVPIVTTSRAQTSYSVYHSDDAAYIALSTDFFKTAGESRYWQSTYSRPPYDLGPDDPVFSEDFRRELLVHELMHIAQAHLQRDPEVFLARVTVWYRDESAGRPVPESDFAIEANRTKYILWWNLFGQAGAPTNPVDCAWQQMDYCARYRGQTSGVEEFAYIGDTILCPAGPAAREARLNEVSDEIAGAYRGVISPEVLALRDSQ